MLVPAFDTHLASSTKPLGNGRWESQEVGGLTYGFVSDQLPCIKSELPHSRTLNSKNRPPIPRSTG